jgi:hypothetical protein
MMMNLSLSCKNIEICNALNFIQGDIVTFEDRMTKLYFRHLPMKGTKRVPDAGAPAVVNDNQSTI